MLHTSREGKPGIRGRWSGSRPHALWLGIIYLASWSLDHLRNRKMIITFVHLLVLLWLSNAIKMVHIVIVPIVVLLVELLKNWTNAPRTELAWSAVNSSLFCSDAVQSFCNRQVSALGDSVKKNAAPLLQISGRKKRNKHLWVLLFSRCVLSTWHLIYSEQQNAPKSA